MAMEQNNTNKKVVINSIIYTFSGLLLKCFSFFLLPLYTAYLTTDDYGINSIATSFIRTMGFIVAFSLFSAVLRFYVDLKDDEVKLKRFYGTIVCFVLLSGLAFFCLFFVFRDALSKYVFQGIGYYPIILVSTVSLIFHCLHSVFDNALKSQQKAMKCAILSIAFFFVTLGFNIFFIVFLRMGALGTILATCIAYFVYSVYFLVDMIVNKKIIFCLDISLLKSALKYSIPIMPHNLSTQIAVLISKVLIGDAASLGALGVYTTAAQFGQVADTIQVYVDNAFGPWLYEKLNARETGYKESIFSITKALIAVIGLMFIGISLFAHDYIVLFLPKSYVESWKYVPMIVLVYAIKTAYYFYVEILFYYKKASRLLFTATLTSSLVNIVLSYYMIPAYGVQGSIMADGIAMLIRVGIIITISKRFEDIGLKLRTFIGNFLLVASFIVVGLSLSWFKYPDRFSFVDFVFKIAVVLIYVLIIGISNRNHIEPLLKMIFRKFKKG